MARPLVALLFFGTLPLVHSSTGLVSHPRRMYLIFIVLTSVIKGHFGAWGYFNTDGFGLNEQFQWCKDMDMLPVLAVPDGHYTDDEVVEPQDLQPWIQSAIDEIHYFIVSFFCLKLRSLYCSKVVNSSTIGPRLYCIWCPPCLSWLPGAMASSLRRNWERGQFV